MKTPFTNHEWETISAYLDDELSSIDSQNFKKSLQNDPRLNSSLQELKNIRRILLAVPRKQSPRNFTLKTSMVEEKIVSLPRLLPVFSFASAISILLIVMSLFFQSFPQSATAAQSAMQAAPQAENSAGTSAADNSSQPPQIINWEGSPSINNQALVYGKGNTGGSPDTFQPPASISPSYAPAPRQTQPNTAENPAPQIHTPSKGLPIETPAQEDLTQPETGHNPNLAQATPLAPAAPSLNTLPSQESLPPQQLTPAPTFNPPTAEPAIEAPTSTPGVVSVQQLQGSGPILGIPPADQRGEMHQSATFTPEQSDFTPTSFFSNFLIIQIALALIAISTAAAALGLWLKYRRERS